MLQGSLVTMKRKCGKEGCRCARGHLHVSLYLATRCEGKRKMIYVPRELEEKARRWVEEGREAARLLETLCQASLENFFKDKEAAKQNRKGPRK